MNLSLENILLFAGTVLSSGWLGTVAAQWLKGRDERAAAVSTASIGREGQLDDLTVDLIAAAKSDIRELREELTMLRPLQTHLMHFEEAISHIEAMLRATTSAELENARKAAGSFLYRIDRTKTAAANIRHEAQVLSSEDDIARDKFAQRNSEGAP